MMTTLSTNSGAATAEVELASDSTKLVAAIPKTVPAAKQALAALELEIDRAETFEKIQRVEHAAEVIKVLFWELDEIRHQAERVIVLANHRVGRQIAGLPKAKGSRGQLKGRLASGVVRKNTPEQTHASLKELVGSTTRGIRLKKLGAVPLAKVEQAIETLQADGKEATVNGVLKVTMANDGLGKGDRAADDVGRIPGKSYGVIVADAGWCDAVAVVQKIAANDAVLLLWATITNLANALSAMSVCGFSYKAHLIWAKEKIELGEWVRPQHEVLLIGTRGNVPSPAAQSRAPSIVLAPPGPDGRRPERFVAMIEEWFPNVPNITLNDRGPRKGWDTGDEEPFKQGSKTDTHNPEGLDLPDFLRRPTNDG